MWIYLKYFLYATRLPSIQLASVLSHPDKMPIIFNSELLSTVCVPLCDENRKGGSASSCGKHQFLILEF